MTVYYQGSNLSNVNVNIAHVINPNHFYLIKTHIRAEDADCVTRAIARAAKFARIRRNSMALDDPTLNGFACYISGNFDKFIRCQIDKIQKDEIGRTWVACWAIDYGRPFSTKATAKLVALREHEQDPGVLLSIYASLNVSE